MRLGLLNYFDIFDLGSRQKNPHRDFNGFNVNLRFSDKGLYHWLVSLEINQPYLKKNQLKKNQKKFLKPQISAKSQFGSGRT